MQKYKKLYVLLILIGIIGFSVLWLSCSQSNAHSQVKQADTILFDTANLLKTPFGEAVLYGRQLMMNTALYIGPKGTNGQYLGNNMSCTNCHQEGGLKPGSFSLVKSQDEYPQYRAREAKILSLSDRVNNCINRPMNGKSLPYDSKEMIALLCYLKWINDKWGKDERFNRDSHNSLVLTSKAANPDTGALLYKENCSRCHGNTGEGVLNNNQDGYVYPPLWGNQSYQAGSSMYRVIKMAGWLKGNMPYDKATPDKPFLSDQQALDIAAFINDDRIHSRPHAVGTIDYPDKFTKPVDYGVAPFVDTFAAAQHKFGPYPVIISYLKSKGLKASY